MLSILVSKLPPMPWAVGGRHLQPGVAGLGAASFIACALVGPVGSNGRSTSTPPAAPTFSPWEKLNVCAVFCHFSISLTGW
jgi:hypothetical protein